MRRFADRDYPAPPWLVHLVGRKPVPVPWNAAARAALALVVPIAVGYAIGRPDLGALVSTGGLPMVLADSGGPYRIRAPRLTIAVLAAGVGYTIGLLTIGFPVVSAVVMVLLAVLSALIGAGSAISGLMLLVLGVVGAGQHTEGAGFWTLLGTFVVGAAWSLVVALAGWTVRATVPERAAVSRVFVQLGVVLEAESPGAARAARHQLSVELNTAYDRLLTARARIARRDATYTSLLTVLSQATPLIEASVAMVNSGERTPRPLINYLADLAAAVLAGAPVPERRPARPVDASPAVVALYAALCKIGDGRTRTPKPPTPLRTVARRRLRKLVPNEVTWGAAARLAFCISLAELVSLLLPMDNVHWITLTVAIVLRPELGSVFGRAVLRGAGTMVGVLIGAALLAVRPEGWVLVVCAALFAGGIAIGKALNYGLLSASVTPLIILLMDIQNLGEPIVLIERLTHTAIGCVIVLIFGYWLWPGSLRPRVGGRVADTVEAVREFVDRGLRLVHTDDELLARSRARRGAYRSLADLRSAFQQVAVEPSAAGRQVTAWWPAIVGLEQVTDAVTELIVSARHGGQLPHQGDISTILDALDELADAVRTGRTPGRIGLPEDGLLAPLADRLNTVLDTIRGPHVG